MLQRKPKLGGRKLSTGPHAAREPAVGHSCFGILQFYICLVVLYKIICLPVFIRIFLSVLLFDVFVGLPLVSPLRRSKTQNSGSAPESPITRSSGDSDQT